MRSFKKKKLNVLFVLGTRPEAIKLAPLILAFKKETRFNTRVCVTAQHRRMLDQVFDFFGIVADYDLNLMRENQTLFDISSSGLKLLESVLNDYSAEVVFVQGDTTTAFIASLAAYYKKIKIAHVEAGLRSGNLHSPFPEEGNRKLISQISNYHFAPTQTAGDHLKAEGITNNVHVVGNTVIDALLWGLEIIRSKGDHEFKAIFSRVDFSKKVILVTGHRRESFGNPFLSICESIKEIATLFKGEVEIVYPVHFNPNVQKPVNEILKDLDNVHLIEPLSYPYLIWLLSKSYLVLTDSGGIQEEAPSLGKPVLVMREVTERMEGVAAGTAKLVGSDRARIVTEVSDLIVSPERYEKMAKAVSPYGDGKTCERILKTFKIE